MVIPQVAQADGLQDELILTALIERGLRGTASKPLRSQEVREAMQEHRYVYFGAVEGTLALFARCIRRPRSSPTTFTAGPYLVVGP